MQSSIKITCIFLILCINLNVVTTLKMFLFALKLSSVILQGPNIYIVKETIFFVLSIIKLSIKNLPSADDQQKTFGIVFGSINNDMATNMAAVESLAYGPSL